MTKAGPWWLALISLFGMLSQMTMAAPVALIIFWTYLDRRKAEGPEQGLRTTARMMGPAAIVAVIVPLLVIAVGMMSSTGMRVGGYTAFAWTDFSRALGDLAAWTFGLTAIPAWLLLIGLALITAIVAMNPPEWLGTRARLYAILILGIPLAVSVIHPGNVVFARYFLCSAIGLLLLASEWIGRELGKSPLRRLGAAASVALLAMASLWQDSFLIQAARGHPDSIVQLMHQKLPGGGRVALETGRLDAVTHVAAIRANYPVVLVHGCAPADFVVSSEPSRLASHGPLIHCGVTMSPIGSGSGTALTGDRWQLYAAGRASNLTVASR